MSRKIKFWQEYVGCMHIHTTDSDGHKSVPEIVKIGKKSGLDFLFFSDHMTLKSYHQNLEGWQQDLLVVIGYEINDLKNQNHFLVFDIDEVLPQELSAVEYVKKTQEKGAFGIIAHPDEERDPRGKYPPYPWTAWDTDKFAGVEIWNQMSEWMERLPKDNQLYLLFSPRKSLIRPPEMTLKRWDELNQKRKVVGIGAIDAHAHPYKVFGIFKVIIFPYEVQFKSIRTHILLKEQLSSDDKTAKKQILDALKNCQVFVSNYRRGDASGFSFYAENKIKKVIIGEKIELDEKSKFYMETPQKCLIRLVGNGKIASEAVTDALEFSPKEKGTYRVECWKKDKGWIFSNHIRVV
jgi:hypothetical protein